MIDSITAILEMVSIFLNVLLSLDPTIFKLSATVYLNIILLFFLNISVMMRLPNNIVRKTSETSYSNQAIGNFTGKMVILLNVRTLLIYLGLSRNQSFLHIKNIFLKIGLYFSILMYFFHSLITNIDLMVQYL